MPFPSFLTGSILSDRRIRRTGSRLLRSAVLLCGLALAACTSLPRTPYSAADASSARVLDIDGLRRYTSGIASSLLDDPSIIRVLFGSGLFGNKRLRELVARYVGPEILAAVARENARGRKLLVVTTDLDTQRTVVWDMGKIAAVGSPE